MDYIDQLLATNEHVVLKRRQHWMAVVQPLVSAVVSLAIWLALLWLVFSGPALPGFLRAVGGPVQTALRGMLPESTALILAAIISLSTLWAMITSVIRWLNHVDIVTDRRVIQVHGILSKASRDSSLEKINDVVLTQTVIGRMLGYGNLTVMTASEVGLSWMSYVPDALGFKRAMMDAKQSVASGAPPQPRGSADSVADRLKQLEGLHTQGVLTDAEYADKRAELIRQL